MFIIYHFGIFVNIPFWFGYNKFGDDMNLRLKDIREDKDITQKEIARFLNCSQVCYSRYENGQRDIPLKTLCNLAKYFNTTTDYILGLTNNPHENQKQK